MNEVLPIVAVIVLPPVAPVLLVSFPFTVFSSVISEVRGNQLNFFSQNDLLWASDQLGCHVCV